MHSGKVSIVIYSRFRVLRPGYELTQLSELAGSPGLVSQIATQIKNLEVVLMHGIALFNGRQRNSGLFNFLSYQPKPPI